MNDRMKLGLTGLARAGAVGWFPGHFGAAVLAGHFLLGRRDLPAEVKEEIATQTDAIPGLAPKLFVPFPEAAALPDAEARLVEALAPNVRKLAKSGHGVIYGSLALRALRERPELATAEIVLGLEKLFASARDDAPDRYWGVADYHAAPMPSDPPPYASLDELARRAFDEMEVVYPEQQIDGETYYFSGEKLHTFTYAQALCDLDSLGYGALAREGLEPHRKHLALSRMTPPSGEPKRPAPDATFTPLTLHYWKRDRFDDHALKLAYAALALLDRARPASYDAGTFWQTLARS